MPRLAAAHARASYDERLRLPAGHRLRGLRRIRCRAHLGRPRFLRQPAPGLAAAGRTDREHRGRRSQAHAHAASAYESAFRICGHDDDVGPHGGDRAGARARGHVVRFSDRGRWRARRLPHQRAQPSLAVDGRGADRRGGRDGTDHRTRQLGQPRLHGAQPEHPGRQLAARLTGQIRPLGRARRGYAAHPRGPAGGRIGSFGRRT